MSSRLRNGSGRILLGEHDWAYRSLMTVKCLRCGSVKDVNDPDGVVPLCECVKASESHQAHGSHYQTGEHEPFDVIDEWATTWKPGAAFYLANCLKYLARLGRKGNDEAAAQDLDKAIHYLQEARRRFYS